MEKQEIYAMLEIHAVVEAETAEEALKKAIETGEFDVIRSTLNDKPARYISLAEYARREGYTTSAYARKLVLRGAIPGAIKIGTQWAIPEDTPRIDRRVSSGKYVGSVWYREYRKKKREESKAKKE